MMPVLQASRIAAKLTPEERERGRSSLIFHQALEALPTDRQREFVRALVTTPTLNAKGAAVALGVKSSTRMGSKWRYRPRIAAAVEVYLNEARRRPRALKSPKPSPVVRKLRIVVCYGDDPGPYRSRGVPSFIPNDGVEVVWRGGPQHLADLSQHNAAYLPDD